MPGSVLVFARSRGAARATALLVGTMVAATQVPVEPVDIRFRAASVGLAPLLSAAPGVFIPILTTRPAGVMKPQRSRRLVLARIIWVALLLGVGWLGGSIGFHGAPGGAFVAARNLATAAGVGLLTAQVLPPLAAWLPAALLLAVTTTYGTTSVSGAPYRWALLLQPTSSGAAAVLAFAVFVPGLATYLARDSAS